MTTIVFVLFDNVTQLDFTGPLQVLSRLPGADVRLAAKSLDPVATDTPMTVNPTDTFDACPQADVLCVPGGFGIEEAVKDESFVDFVKRQAAGAKYVTSVCTGAFALGAAGLLKGKRATTHWAYHDLLRAVGAEPVAKRVVRDGNVFTGGGVTAGIDFGFALFAELAGEEMAKAIQLGLEYDPAPPFPGGHPSSAEPQTHDLVSAFYGDRKKEFEATLTSLMTS
ncbi:MAG: DJ-1/PfpI family protein [Pseudomonadota bacterium]